MQWLSVFPFPPSIDDSIDVDGFIRAITLISDSSILDGHASGSGELGSHSGSYTFRRQRTAQDRKRMLFRSLAKLLNSDARVSNIDTRSISEAQRQETVGCRTVTVSYFVEHKYDEATEPFSEAWLNSCVSVHFVSEDDERSIDLLDILCITSPFNDEDHWPPVAPPSRSAFRVVLPTLPRQNFYLDELRISHADLFEFLKLVSVLNMMAEGLEIPSMPQIVEKASTKLCKIFCDGEEDISWEVFDNVLSQSLVCYNFLNIDFQIYSS
jgi:hypothetical protein